MIEIIIATVINLLTAVTPLAAPAEAQAKEQQAAPQAAALSTKSDQPQPIINPAI
ncbi:hypothetical protein GCM10007907_20760 [Chitinimonas prasina]|uniref:Uncharacterized protein n=1 Tax=Chitinimonas prasina TaxID=1434937 RepID=A0ABQ5YFD1_9NEIS|nr:hypothetical protein [Chitinimonas prasina]GLR13286.1 hypothetical protein GCM10007907_20760 [Chitinimonas prasina]